MTGRWYEEPDDADNGHDETLKQRAINTLREPLIVLDYDLRVFAASHSFAVSSKCCLKRPWDSLSMTWAINSGISPKLQDMMETILPKQTIFDNYKVEHDLAAIGRRSILLNARKNQGIPGKRR